MDIQFITLPKNGLISAQHVIWRGDGYAFYTAGNKQYLYKQGYDMKPRLDGYLPYFTLLNHTDISGVSGVKIDVICTGYNTPRFD